MDPSVRKITAGFGGLLSAALFVLMTLLIEKGYTSVLKNDHPYDPGININLGFSTYFNLAVLGALLGYIAVYTQAEINKLPKVKLRTQANELLLEQENLAGVVVPNDFRDNCFTKGIMTDPGTLLLENGSWGATMDRQSFDTWVEMGHTHCPITSEEIKDWIARPDLKEAIDAWIAEQIKTKRLEEQGLVPLAETPSTFFNHKQLTTVETIPEESSHSLS